MAYDYESFKTDVNRLIDLDLNLYKERQMKRRIESLIARKGYKGFEDFMKGMKKDQDLLRTFVSYLTINVSQFYRNPAQWINLELDIIPYLRENYGDKLTIWSAACSTGDEPYTLAMLFSKYISLDKLSIIATDIDDDVLEIAKTGIYSQKSLEDLPKELLNRYFDKLDEKTYSISDSIRKCVTFKKHNLLKDPYIQGINLVVCRNVVIYFTDEAKEEIYRKFNESLQPGGILFVGSTEQIMGAYDLGFKSYRTFFYKKFN